MSSSAPPDHRRSAIVDDATLCFRKRFKFRKRSKSGEVDVCFCKRFNAGEAEIFPIGQIHLSIDLTGGAGDHLAARGMSNCAFGTCQGIGSTAGSTAGSVSAAQSGCKSGAAQHSESVIRSVFISHLISFLNHGCLRASITSSLCGAIFLSIWKRPRYPGKPF